MEEKIAKLGRNEPCWCGSGVKYKECHLHRSFAPELGKGEIIKAAKDFGKDKLCSVPEEIKHECKGKIVKAHTLSKSSSLRMISENGKVIGLKADMGKLFDSSGKMEPTKTGIKQASTFTGFCEFHDKKLFSPIENTSFTPTKENCFLAAYRVVSREIYLKIQAIKYTVPLMRRLDSGKDLQKQIFIQATANNYETGTKMAIEDNNRAKNLMDPILINSSYDDMEHYVFELAPGQKISAGGSVLADYDFDGNRLQNLEEAGLDHLIFNCFPTKQGGYFVFSWFKSDSKIGQSFIDSLKKKPEIGERLTSFLFSYCENTFYTPSWWENLTESAREKLQERIYHGTRTPTTKSTLQVDKDTYRALIVTNQYPA